MKTKEFCYWCGAISTNREHVPPKCLFPEKKDVHSILHETYRNDLITVPSCDKHNLAKSHDDEYLMVCLASRVGNNIEAFVHTQTKVRRSINRNPSLIEIDSEGILTINDTKYPVQLAKIDTNRINKSFEAIARAIFYHEYGFRFKGKCQIITRLHYNPEAKKSTSFYSRACELIELEMSSWKTEIKGNNPKIFTYQFSPEDGFKTRTLCLSFYEKIKVYVILIALNSEELKSFQEKYSFISNMYFGDILKS